MSSSTPHHQLHRYNNKSLQNYLIPFWRWASFCNRNTEEQSVSNDRASRIQLFHMLMCSPLHFKTLQSPFSTHRDHPLFLMCGQNMRALQKARLPSVLLHCVAALCISQLCVSSKCFAALCISPLCCCTVYFSTVCCSTVYFSSVCCCIVYFSTVLLHPL